MQNIEAEFNTYYSEQLDCSNLLPPFITQSIIIRECLSLSENKCVYVVSDAISNQKYILKQMSIQRLSQSEMERDMLSALNHPCIPKLYKWHVDDNYTYMVREYFDGMTLDAYVLGKGPVQENEAIGLAMQICDLLAYLHSQNPPVIHRDIKPENLILRPDGKIGLIDFDTSRRYDLHAEKDTIYLGTVQTAAPEQFGYRQTNHQTDIYALGILLIYLETGGYDRSNMDNMTSGLKRIAKKCTEFSPKDRYKTVSEIKKHLLGKRSAIPVKIVVSVVSIGIMVLLSSLAGVYNMEKQAAPANPASNEHGEKETEPVTFKNPGIEKAVRNALGKDAGQPLSKPELEHIVYLEIIGDLEKPIAYEELQHDYNGNRVAYKGEYLNRGTVNSLEDLALLPSLKELTLVYQQISELSGIEKLHLQKLIVSYNNISDLTPLKEMESLTFLRMNCNPIEDLSPLKNLSKLEFLQISATYVDDLSPVASLQSLTTLDVWGIKNIDLTPLKDLKNLKEIYQ